jgi:hypothetical protein
MSKAGVEFVENKGQVIDDKGVVRRDIQYTAASNNTKLYLFGDKISYVFTKVSGVKNAANPVDMDYSEAKTSVYRMDMQLVGARDNTTIRATSLLPNVSNYYTAGLSADGVTGVLICF